MKVSIIYPAAPFEVIPGGIDTFIKGILDYAPHAIDFEMIGITTDASRFKVGRWHELVVMGGRRVRFLPVLEERDSGVRAKIPLSLRFTLSLLKFYREISGDVLEFHRFEPSFLFVFDLRPKTLFIHQDTTAYGKVKSDVRWSSFGGIYDFLEKMFLKRFRLIHCVKESIAVLYSQKLKAARVDVRFSPTWFDPAVFKYSDENRHSCRRKISEKHGFADTDKVLMYVGRFDHQKDPLFLIHAFQRAFEQDRSYKLLLIGDGILRGEIESLIKKQKLENIFLIGVKPKNVVAEYLAAADVFVLPSRYEGMPIALLEAIASGVPSVATNVGEVSRILNHRNGILVLERDVTSVAQAMKDATDNSSKYDRFDVSQSVQHFTPDNTLELVYARYRTMLKDDRTY